MMTETIKYRWLIFDHMIMEMKSEWLRKDLGPKLLWQILMIGLWFGGIKLGLRYISSFPFYLSISNLAALKK